MEKDSLRNSQLVGNSPGHSPVKTKLLIALTVVGAAALGFWLGCYRTAQTWNRIVEGQIRKLARTETRNRAQVNLRVLNYLKSGSQSEAIEILERQLDVAVIGCAAYWNSDAPEERSGNDIMIIRDARDYRAQFPWTNQRPDTAEGVQRAFELAK